MRSKPTIEIADIFRKYMITFLSDHIITKQHRKVISAIMNCRTGVLGGHLEKCSNREFDYETNAYNSCRDRHCPKCTGTKRIKWVSQRLKEILPTHYFHVIFTLPSALRQLALHNQAVIYDLFFKTSSYTMKRFSQDKQYLGAKMGFMGILHSWGQTLSYHPHLHYIVTGGGLSDGNTQWVRLPYQKKFIFPVKAMSKVMMGRFIHLLKDCYQKHLLRFPGNLKDISTPYRFKQFCSNLYQQSWYIYAKPPYTGPDRVIRYFGRYTHRVAISNDRLLNIDNNTITFQYRDYKDNSQMKTMTLSANSFIQRFLWHILPSGFRKIRYYGILSPGLITEALAIVSNLIASGVQTINRTIQDYVDRFSAILNHLCPQCGTGRLLFYYFNSS